MWINVYSVHSNKRLLTIFYCSQFEETSLFFNLGSVEHAFKPHTYVCQCNVCLLHIYAFSIFTFKSFVALRLYNWKLCICIYEYVWVELGLCRSIKICTFRVCVSHKYTHITRGCFTHMHILNVYVRVNCLWLIKHCVFSNKWEIVSP